MNTHQLQPVPFHQDTIFVIDHLGQPFVPLRPLVENMGLDWKTQYDKVMARQERFCVGVIPTQMPGDDQRREMVCIPLKKINAWLYSIHPDKVAPHLKDKIELYQDECDEVLFNFWFKGIGLPDRQLVGKTVVATDEYVELLKIRGDFYQEKAEPKKRVNFTRDEDARVIQLQGLGYSQRQIGEQIGRPLSSIRSCISRLRKAGLLASALTGNERQLPLFGGEA